MINPACRVNRHGDIRGADSNIPAKPALINDAAAFEMTMSDKNILIYSWYVMKKSWSNHQC